MKGIFLDEESYVVGIDLGYETATVSYLDHHSLKPVMYDLSGGYGDTSIPIAMQYLPDEDNWLIGENAFLSDSQAVKVITGLTGLKELLPQFILKVLEGFTAINPYARIDYLTLSVPDEIFEGFLGLTEQLREKLAAEITLIRTSQAITYALKRLGDFEKKTHYVLFYGEMAFRAIEILHHHSVTIRHLLVEQELGSKKIEWVIREELLRVLREARGSELQSDEEKLQFERMYRQYLPLILQKYFGKKPIKLYFNFMYPPIQKNISYEQLHELLQPFFVKMEETLKELNPELIKNSYTLGVGTKIYGQKDGKPLGPTDSESPAFIVSKGCVWKALDSISKIPPILFEYEKEEAPRIYEVQVFHEGNLICKKQTEHLKTELLLIVDFEEDVRGTLQILALEMQGDEVLEKNLVLYQRNSENKARAHIRITIKDKDIFHELTYLPL